jgi:hypothetical protein
VLRFVRGGRASIFSDLGLTFHLNIPFNMYTREQAMPRKKRTQPKRGSGSNDGPEGDVLAKPSHGFQGALSTPGFDLAIPTCFQDALKRLHALTNAPETFVMPPPELAEVC